MSVLDEDLKAMILAAYDAADSQPNSAGELIGDQLGGADLLYEITTALYNHVKYGRHGPDELSGIGRVRDAAEEYRARRVSGLSEE